MRSDWSIWAFPIFDQARVHATQNDAHVVFDFGGGDTLTVRNTTITVMGNDLFFV